MGVARPEEVELLVSEVLGKDGVFAKDSVGGFPDIGGGMIPVEDLGGIGKVLLGLFPNPVSAIADDNRPKVSTVVRSV